MNLTAEETKKRRILVNWKKIAKLGYGEKAELNREKNCKTFGIWLKFLIYVKSQKERGCNGEQIILETRWLIISPK